jgi:hypothetical protein
MKGLLSAQENLTMKTRLASSTIVIGVAFLFNAHLLAADLIWIGGTGNWNAAGHWSPAQVPTAADNTWITNSGTYTVTVPAGTTATNNSLTLGGAAGVQTLAVDRATLSVNGASLINPNGQLSFLVAQSVVTGPGNLTVNGILNWANGTMSGAGVTTIGSGGTLIIGSGGVTLGRTLNNGGNGSWSGGNLTISAGNSLNNLAGGTFDITADGRLSGASTTPINNSGLVRLTAGTTGTIITAPFNNGGNLYVLASVLNLNLGGTHSGIISNAAGATLNFGGGSHVLTATSLVTGAGTLGMSGATTLSASGTFDLGSALSVSAGVASLASGCNVTGSTLTVGGAGGVINYNSAGSVFAINLNAGTLGGSSPIIVTGPISLGGGSVTNPLVTASGGLSISGNVTLNGTRLINPGTAVWSAGNITGANGATITNVLGATFINSFDGNAMTGVGATPLFINAGTFQKTNGTAAAGTTAINFQFFNTGTVEVKTNTLRYAINQQTAGITLLDGGGLSAQGQPLQMLGGSLMGTGLVTVANTLNVVNSASISPGLPIGELDISGNYQQTSNCCQSRRRSTGNHVRPDVQSSVSAEHLQRPRWRSTDVFRLGLASRHCVLRFHSHIFRHSNFSRRVPGNGECQRCRHAKPHSDQHLRHHGRSGVAQYCGATANQGLRLGGSSANVHGDRTAIGRRREHRANRRFNSIFWRKRGGWTLSHYSRDAVS